ncbi:MAG: phosphatase PAP2 family protein, partial [Alphaproteobacteria bacterium]
TLWAVIKFGNLDELKRATCLKVAQAAGFVFACVALGGIATNIVKALVGRARPKLLFREETYGFDPLILDASWHSFPSGHTNSAIAAALALAMLFPKVRWPLLMLGGLIAFSRVAVTAHYMADIVGGTVLAVLTCWFVGKYFAHKNWLFTESPAGLTVRP